MSLQFNAPYMTIFDDDGQIVVGAKAYFYTTGGAFTTPKDVYSDSGLTTAISQPVLSDAAGRLPRIFLNGQYDVVLKYPDGTTLKTIEGYDPGLSSALGTGVALGIDQGGTGATTASAALTALGAASQTQFNSLSNTVSDNNTAITTGVNEDGEFGALAPLDTINSADLIDDDVQEALNPFGLQLLNFQYVLTSGTDGTNFFGSATWGKATINNTVTNEIDSASISSSVISLPAGTYWLEVYATTQRNGASAIMKLRARDTTNSETLVNGLSAKASSGGVVVSMRGRFTLSGTANVEIQGYANSAASGNENVSSGEQEVYLDGMIWKIS